jgi:hypothetical protein
MLRDIDSGRISSDAAACGLCEPIPGQATTWAACQPCHFAILWANKPFGAARLKIPTLRVGDQEVAEHLDARHRLEFFRIDEIGVERQRIRFAEKLH